MARGPNYWEYLRLDELLELQGGIEDDENELMPDELHFIVVHQTFELWFKMILRELCLAINHLGTPSVAEETVPYVVHHVRRINQILRLLVDQFLVMETLTPQDFLGFRDKLAPASGFQSFQMREIEIRLGMATEGRVKYGNVDPLEHIRKSAAGTVGGDAIMGRIERAIGEPSLRQTLHDWLHRTPIEGSSPGDEGDEEVVMDFLERYLASVEKMHEQQGEIMARAGVGDADAARQRLAHTTELGRAFLFAEDVEDEPERARVRRIRAGLIFIESYRALPLLAFPRLLVDAVVELEEQMVLFRTRHARMVERIIGRRVGTGGSSGVDYLDMTTKVRIFKDLWSVRTLLLAKDDLPALKNSSFYRFATHAD
jgi:tryptophan 2,3-dioxygenase